MFCPFKIYKNVYILNKNSDRLALFTILLSDYNICYFYSFDMLPISNKTSLKISK